MNTVIKGTKTIAEYKRVREDMENLARANYARHKEALRRRSRKRHRRRDGTRAQEAEQRKQSKYSLKWRSAYQQTSGKPFLSAWSSITAMKRGEWKCSKLK